MKTTDLKKWIEKKGVVHITENFVTNEHSAFTKEALSFYCPEMKDTITKETLQILSAKSQIKEDLGRELETRLETLFQQEKSLQLLQSRILYDLNDDSKRLGRLLRSAQDHHIWVDNFYLQLIYTPAIYAVEEAPNENPLQIGEEKSFIVMPFKLEDINELNYIDDEITGKRRPKMRRLL